MSLPSLEEGKWAMGIISANPTRRRAQASKVRLTDLAATERARLHGCYTVESGVSTSTRACRALDAGKAGPSRAGSGLPDGANRAKTAKTTV